MKFKEYLEKITDPSKPIVMVDEVCNDRFICRHTIFGLDSDDPELLGECYLLLGTISGDDPTIIPVDQEIEIKDDCILVTDSEFSRITLRFYTATVIPHPDGVK